MKFIEALKLRYATKLYDTSLSVDDVTIGEIAEILRLSPSSINSQPWQFTIITDKKTKAQLAENSFFNKQKIEEAPILVVFSICNNLSAFEHWAQLELPKPNLDYYTSVIKPMGEEATKRWFTNQLYISIGILLSACATMELDATPMEGIDTKIYDSILDNVDYHATVAVAVGYRSGADKNQPDITPKQRRSLREVVKFVK